MPSMFNARDADNYERLMGRWSRRLAPLFIEHAGIADGENVIEIGCCTGSLTFTLPQKAALGRLTAVDHSEIYLAAAKAKNKDPRISLEQGDGCALRFPDASFDRALSMLVLPSVLPEPELMVAEMRRVTRPGGVVAAAFLDSPEQELLAPLRAGLCRQGDFSAVVETGSALKPDIIVEIDVSQLFGDFRQPGSPKTL